MVKTRRLRRRRLRRHRHGCSTASGPRWTRSSDGTISAGRRRGDPLRGPQGRPRHARDARRSPARSRARASARTCCCSPTAGSPAAPPGLCIGHVAPEAVDGGPIAFVRDGDRIRLDIASGTLDVDVDNGRIRRRQRGLHPLPPRTQTACWPSTVKLVRFGVDRRDLQLTSA